MCATLTFVLYKYTDMINASLVPCCRLCGATSYRRVVARDEQGCTTVSGLFQCSGCSVVFADPRAWCEGGDEGLPFEPPAVKPMIPIAAKATAKAPASTDVIPVSHG